MKHKKLIKTVALLAVFTTMGATMAACRGDQHSLTKHDAVEANCMQEGNIEYWDCSHCDKLFADEKGETEITDYVIPKTGHTIGDNDYHAATLPDCEKDGSLAYWECSDCHKKFANKDGLKEITDVMDPAAHTPSHVNRVEPTFDAPGKKEYWQCDVCKKLFLEEEMTTPVTEADLVLERLPEYDVELTLSLKDKSGAAVTDFTGLSDVRIHLTHSDARLAKVYVAKIGANGKLALVKVSEGEAPEETDAPSKMGAGTYSVSFVGGGYYNTVLEIGETGNTKTIATEETEHALSGVTQEGFVFALDASGKKTIEYHGTGWTNGENVSTVTLASDAVTGTHYMLDFTVKADDWTAWTSRFAVALTDGTGADNYVGFTLKLAGDEAKTMLYQDNNLNDRGEEAFKTGADAFAAGITGVNGVQMRAIRNGSKISLLAYLNGEWTELRSYTLSGEHGARLALAMQTPDTFTFSELAFGEYVGQVDPEVGKKGAEAHFKVGEKLYTLEGVETTAAQLELPAIVEESKSFTVTFRHEGETLTPPAEMEYNVEFTPVRGKSYTLAAKGNAIAASPIAVGITYTVSVSFGDEAGFDDATVEITEGTTSYELVFYVNQHTATNPNTDHPEYLTVARDENGKNVYAFNVPWIADSDADGAKAVIADIKDEALAGDHYIADFTVSMSNYTTDWTSRFFVYAAAGGSNANVGYGFITGTETEVLITIDLKGDNVYRNTNNIQKLDGDPEGKGGEHNAYNGAAMRAALKTEEGLQLRVARNGRTVSFLAYVPKTEGEGKEWQVFRTLTLTDDYGARLAFAATSPDVIKFSDVSFGEYCEAEVSASKVTSAHFIKDGKLYYTNGTEATESGLNAEKLASVTLVLKDENGFLAEGTKIKLTHDVLEGAEGVVGKNGEVVLENKVFEGYEYLAEIEGCLWKYYAITIDGTEVLFDKITDAYSSVLNIELDKSHEFEGVQNGSSIEASTDDTIVLATNGWATADQVILKTTDILKNANKFTLYFNWKVSQIEGWAGNRYGIRISDTTSKGEACGFFVWGNTDQSTIQVGYLYGDINFNRDGLPTAEFKTVSGLTAEMLLVGADFKVEYDTGIATLYVKVESDWVKLYEVTTVGKPQVAFAAGHATHTYTDVKLEVVPNVNKTISITLHNSAGALAEGTNVSFTNLVRGETVSQKIGANGVVTLETPYLGNYLVEVEGISFALNFTEEKLTAEKLLETLYTYDNAEDLSVVQGSGDWAAQGSFTT
ncbi:MAG: hypothetical protein NC548_44675, partial [Lachnospiraceae bacterium]|nr:hypothetical protein [Lachnospiraceae bacterium]